MNWLDLGLLMLVPVGFVAVAAFALRTGRYRPKPEANGR